MRLSNIVMDSRTITLHLEQGDLTCTYRPSGYTAEVEEILLASSTKPLTTLVEILANMLVSWDLLDGEQEIPITKENLSKLPAMFLVAVLKGLMEDMKPDPTKQPA